MRSPTTTNPGDSLLCGSASCGDRHQCRAPWWHATLRQTGTLVVPQDDNRSLSTGRACIVSADGVAAEEPPFDRRIAVATKTHV